MALINSGSFDDFVEVEESLLNSGLQELSIDESSSYLHLETISQPKDTVVRFPSSNEARGLSLKSILLTKDFDGFLAKMFNKSNELYFFTWVYDLSGEPIQFYPGVGIDPSQLLIKLKTGTIREFIGAGINLFPKRIVKGGMVVRIQIWECDEKTRNIGKVMSQTAEAIQKSNLKNALSAIAGLTSMPGAAVVAITTAAIELGKIIGDILQTNGDDQVDLFEGYYPADFPWEKENDKYLGDASEIVLGKY